MKECRWKQLQTREKYKMIINQKQTIENLATNKIYITYIDMKIEYEIISFQREKLRANLTKLKLWTYTKEDRVTDIKKWNRIEFS